MRHNIHYKGGDEMEIGQKIKIARLAKGYTQEELAEKVGVQKSAVAKWENGRVSEIKRSNLDKLSKVLGINPNSLLSDIEERPVEMGEKIADIALNAEMLELIEKYNSLSDENKVLARQHLDFLLGRN